MEPNEEFEELDGGGSLSPREFSRTMWASF